MSSHSNFKKEKCWSCEFFSGKREYKKGLLLGDSVNTDYKGKCSNKRSLKYNHEIDDESWCSKYQKWGVLQSALAVEQQKKESQRIANELKKEQQKVETSNSPSRPISSKERAEMHARWEEKERQEQLEKKQRAIAFQEAKINKIKKSPIVAGVVGTIITLFIFLLGWIPYWYFNRILTLIKEEILWHEKMGYSPNSSSVLFLYQEGLRAKEMRDSVICIPFIILGIGIAVTIAMVILFSKTKTKKLEAAYKELEELKK